MVFKQVNMESYHGLFPILRQFKLVGLALKETEYEKAKLEELGEMLIDLAGKGLCALDQLFSKEQDYE